MKIIFFSLNIAEGNGKRFPRDRRKYFDSAIGSASEVSSVLDIALAYKYMNQAKYDCIQNKLVQIVKILYKLS